MENSGKNIEYSELICRSNFSFLKGGSSPEEIIERAKYLGYKSIAITDEVSVAGLVRAHKAAKQNNIKLAVFGESTLKKAKEIGLEVDIKAPSSEFPSMSMALDSFLKNTKL